MHKGNYIYGRGVGDGPWYVMVGVYNIMCNFSRFIQRNV